MNIVSTGLECRFYEIKPDVWYYLLEDWNSPKGGFDWREYATAYGPFDNLAKAREHLNEEQANPGGSWNIPYAPDFKMDEVMEKLIAQAVSPEPLGFSPWR